MPTRNNVAIFGLSVVVVTALFLLAGDSDLLIGKEMAVPITRHAAAVATTSTAVEDSRKMAWESLHVATEPPAPELLEKRLPKWVNDYVVWHQEMRKKFPDRLLLEHSDAPKVMIRYCRKSCGGTNDRLKDLLNLLYVAKMSGRLLLLKWYVPFPLESFLSPNIINWTVPDTDQTTTAKALTTNFHQYCSKKQEKSMENKTIIVSDCKGASRLKGEAINAIESTDFGAIWYLFFRPSDGVKKILVRTFETLNISPWNYTAVHLRVRHPANFARKKRLPSGQKWKNADSSGLQWTDENKNYAVKTAINAIRCSAILSNRTKEPLYMFSDSEDLVKFMIHATKNHSGTMNVTELDQLSQEAVSRVHLVSRELNVPTAHLDAGYDVNNQEGGANYTWESFADSFVDLYIAIHSRCITVGLGNFAILATKISGSKCLMRHQKVSKKVMLKWGSRSGLEIPVCPAPVPGRKQK